MGLNTSTLETKKLFDEGKTVDEIAKIRKMKVATIEKHMELINAVEDVEAVVEPVAEQGTITGTEQPVEAVTEQGTEVAIVEENDTELPPIPVLKAIQDDVNNLLKESKKDRTIEESVAYIKGLTVGAGVRAVLIGEELDRVKDQLGSQKALLKFAFDNFGYKKTHTYDLINLGRAFSGNIVAIEDKGVRELLEIAKKGKGIANGEEAEDKAEDKAEEKKPCIKIKHAISVIGKLADSIEERGICESKDLTVEDGSVDLRSECLRLMEAIGIKVHFEEENIMEAEVSNGETDKTPTKG